LSFLNINASLEYDLTIGCVPAASKAVDKCCYRSLATIDASSRCSCDFGTSNNVSVWPGVKDVSISSEFAEYQSERRSDIPF
jgi:hypothetical protein